MSKTIETRDRHIDTNTGEVIYDKTNVISFTHLPNEPEYIKLYINDLGGLGKLLGKGQNCHKDGFIFL
jgi:hypothetical protein